MNIAINKLILYKNNARQHSSEHIKKLANSIKTLGWIKLIVITKDYRVIAGHACIGAAKLLGLEEVPVTMLERDITEEQYKALVLADNRLAELSTWDNDLLSEELQALLNDNYDLNLIGFDEDYVKSLLGNIDSIGMPDLSSDDRSEFKNVTFTLHTSQVEIIEKALARALKEIPKDDLNDNKNGNAIAHICELYLNV